MRNAARLLLLASLTIILAGCATQTSEKTDATTSEQAPEDVSEEQLILTNSDIEYVFEEVTSDLSQSRLHRKWQRSGSSIKAAMYPPIVHSDQKLAGMISSLFTKLEEELEGYYGLDLASPLMFRGAQEPDDGTIVTDTMLQRARDNNVQYLISGIIDANRAAESATYAFDIQVIEVESGDVAFRKKVVREKP